MSEAAEDEAPEQAGRGRASDRVRRWCFTAHVNEREPGPPEITHDPALVRFYIYQLEVCPTTGKQHYQGYVELRESTRLETVKRRILKRGAHLEKARGSAKENIVYCSKLESRADPAAEPKTWGEPYEPKKHKEKLYEVIEALESGDAEDTVRARWPETFFKHRDKIRNYKNSVDKEQVPDERSVYVEVRWGAHGTGKSSSVYNKEIATSKGLHWWKAKHVFKKTANMDGWWDGYDLQRVLLLDDFYPTSLKDAERFLTLVDPRKTQLNVKGSSTFSAWTHVVITANVPVENWFRTHSGQSTIPDEVRAAVEDRIPIANRHHFVGPSMRALAPAVPFIPASQEE